jgi:hypothetical protein
MMSVAELETVAETLVFACGTLIEHPKIPGAVPSPEIERHLFDRRECNVSME